MQAQRGSPSSTTFSSDSSLRVAHYGMSPAAGFTVSPHERGVRLMQPSPAPSSPTSTDHTAFGYFLPPASDIHNSVDGYTGHSTHDGAVSDAWATQHQSYSNYHDPASSASTSSPQPFFTAGDTSLHRSQDAYGTHQQLSDTRRSSWGGGVCRTVPGLGSDRRASAPYAFHMSPYSPAHSAAGFSSTSSPGRAHSSQSMFPARKSPLQESVAADYSSMSLSSHFSNDSSAPRTDPLLSILAGSDAVPSMYGESASGHQQSRSSNFHFHTASDPTMLPSTSPDADARW